MPELDHYQDRGEAAYFGPIFAPFAFKYIVQNGVTRMGSPQKMRTTLMEPL